jgi:conjugative relaxase-like TrwC/TraI family protein
MVSISPELSIENAGTYYRVHYSTVGEYYAPTEEPTIGQAIGQGAQALGISGAITAEQFESLLHGRDPISNAQLRAKPLWAEAEERAGFDITLSPPKSISIQALVAGDTRLIDAVRQAALFTIKEAERCAFSRQHGGKEWVQTANICAVMFEHYDARESINSQHGPMPQLHYHTFVTNLTQRPDNQWRAIDAEQIYKARPHLDSVFMSEIARNVQQLGYGIVRGSKGSFELEGFSREQIEVFSERSQDIERTKAERGIINPKAARDIIIETRKAKREHDPECLKAERLALAAKQGIDVNYRPSVALQRSTNPEFEAQKSLAFALRHTTSRNAVPDDRAIELAALKHGIGVTDLAHVRASMAVERQRGNLIQVESSHRHPLGSHTTKEMAELEWENLTLVREGMNRGRPIAGITIQNPVTGIVSGTGASDVRKWAAEKKLLPDQTEAAVFTLTSGHWATAIEGLAGTAKTSLVGAIKEYAEQQGWKVYGSGTTSGSVEALERVGLDARTVAKLRATPLPSRTSQELWIIDESSLLATVPVNELLNLAKERGVERIVFVGDQRQHLAIEAGAPVRQFLADNMAVTQLTTIRRQKDPGLLQAVELTTQGRINEAVDLLIEQKRVTEIKDSAGRYQAIAAEYLATHEARQNCLVVSPANEERRAINQAIRQKLVDAGYVQRLGQEHQILIPRDMTDALRQHALSYHEGEVIYFRRANKAQHIPARAYLTVAGVHEDSLTLRFENGRLIEFDPRRMTAVNVYTQETRTIAVGDRLEWRERDNARQIANHRQAVVTKLDRRNIEVVLENGRKLSMPLADARKVDLAYCVTSHASQGSTVHKAIIHIDSSRGADLVNDRQWYVSKTRPEWDLRIYTDSVQGMRRAVARTQEKELALDVTQRQQSHRQSVGMRV